MHVSPMIMMVAVAVLPSPPPQHSPMFGHLASSQTVARPRSRTVLRRALKLSDVAGWTFSQVEVGGEVRVRGSSPRGDAWRIAVERPDPGAQRGIQAALTVSDTGIATSGDYRNFFEHQGQRYSHLIDPRTGYPIQHDVVSVTVVHGSAMMADAWATALTVMGSAEAMVLAEERGLELVDGRDLDLPAGAGPNEPHQCRQRLEQAVVEGRVGRVAADPGQEDAEELAAMFPAEGDTVEIVWQKDTTLGVDGVGDRCIVAALRGPFPDKNNRRSTLPAYHVYAELRSLVRLAGDQENAFERVDETDRRPKHVHPKYKLSLHARGTVWRRVDVDGEGEDS